MSPIAIIMPEHCGVLGTCYLLTIYSLFFPCQMPIQVTYPNMSKTQRDKIWPQIIFARYKM